MTDVPAADADTTMKEALARASEASGFDLALRCREIAEWRRTGRYGGTELQRMADTLDDQSVEDPPIARAELATIREVLRFVGSFASPAEGVR